MTLSALGWQEEHLLDDRRHRRNGFMVSVALHGLVFAALVISPRGHVPPLPVVLSVDLIAALPSPRVPRPRSVPKAPAPKVAPKPEPTPPSAPKAAPEPIAPPPPAPPIVKAPVQVLPENSPSKIRPEKPPQQVARKLDPKPEPRARRPREKELSYEDAMAALGDELGPEETSDLLQPVPEEEPEASAGTPEPTAGVRISPEMGAWITATTRQIQNDWKGVASFRGRGLVTALEIKLSATGQVLGTPRVVKSSGDPYFDDNAVRAVKWVDPLPAPPRAGVTIFYFRSEEY